MLIFRKFSIYLWVAKNSFPSCHCSSFYHHFFETCPWVHHWSLEATVHGAVLGTLAVPGYAAWNFYKMNGVKSMIMNHLIRTDWQLVASCSRLTRAVPDPWFLSSWGQPPNFSHFCNAVVPSGRREFFLVSLQRAPSLSFAGFSVVLCPFHLVNGKSPWRGSRHFLESSMISLELFSMGVDLIHITILDKDGQSIIVSTRLSCCRVFYCSLSIPESFHTRHSRCATPQTAFQMAQCGLICYNLLVLCAEWNHQFSIIFG